MFLGAFAKLRKTTVSFVMSVRPSVRPHGTRLPLNRFSLNLICEYFSKICPENSSFIEMWQRITVTLYEDQYTFSIYLAHFFLECKMFQIQVVEKLETHILCPTTFSLFRKSCRLCENVENVVQRSRPRMAICRTRIACWIHTHTHTQVV